eukprot:scaffold291875_cov19-Tisochrysis_lutea.AAC.1
MHGEPQEEGEGQNDSLNAQWANSHDSNPRARGIAPRARRACATSLPPREEKRERERKCRRGGVERLLRTSRAKASGSKVK